MLVEPKKVEKRKRITLTSKKVSELLAEAIVTIVLLLLLNVPIMFLLEQLLSENSPLAGIVWAAKDAVAKKLNTDLFWGWDKFVLPISFLVDAAALYWRLIRRYHQMRLHHIIGELHYIIDGNYNHHIPFELSDDLTKVVTSISDLVDSTVAAIEDERRVEKSKDELITNVSYDIRAPLTSIIGYLGLIEDHQLHSQEDLLKYTHTAYVKVKQIKLLADDLFEYTKIRQPSIPIHTTTFDMAQLIEQPAADFELEVKKIDMQIQVKTNPASLMMEGDIGKLVRIFNDLLSNTSKYGKDGHHIVMEVDKIGIGAIITVHNDEPAIPRHSLDQLFGRFYRVEEPRSQEAGSTGLGLAIAQSTVALYGGCTYAKSDQR